MEKAWGKFHADSLEIHGAWSQSKIPWFSWGNFHAFYAIAWDRKIVKIFQMKAWNLKPWKAWEFTKMKAWEARYSLVYYF